MDRGAGVDACRVFPGQLQFDVRVKNALARGAARVFLLGAEQVVKVMGIGHVVASASSRMG
jgi:hypothetical protein